MAAFLEPTNTVQIISSFLKKLLSKMFLAMQKLLKKVLLDP